MAGDDREAVLETVRTFFTNVYRSPEECFAGPLLEWQMLVRQLLVTAPYKLAGALDSAVVTELSGTRAVVYVRAGLRFILRNGGEGSAGRLDGPVVLEKVGERWLIVDYTDNGHPVLERVVLGPLAEQERAGVTVRVLAVERSTRGTAYIAELTNATALEATIWRADERHEGTKGWARVFFVPRTPVPPGESSLLQILSETPLEPLTTTAALSLCVRDGWSERPFRLAVPLTPPESAAP